MNWICKSRENRTGQRDHKYASLVEMTTEFDVHTEKLHWLAEVITGDATLADECVVNARDLASQSNGVFRGWLEQWARSATIRHSIDCIRKEIADSEGKYSQVRCEHGGHEPFPIEQADAIQRLSAQELVAMLDPYARAVMILRGVQRASVQQCALTLGTSRASVTAAFCLSDQIMTSCVQDRALSGDPVIIENGFAEKRLSNAG